MFALADQPLDPAALRASLPQPEDGALVVFEGWVRNHHDGRPVLGLTYEAAADLCQIEAAQILAEARQRFAVRDLRVAHRVGRLAVGEVAVWVGVTAAHRDAAFQACRFVIDELKRRLPIWKKEFYADGQTAWVGCEGCA
jgi:molybdopterin synthase catalytic subunit